MNKKVICIIVCVVICVLAGIGISSYEKRKKGDLKTEQMDEGISKEENIGAEENISKEEQQTETVDSENQPVESMESTDSNLTLMVDGSISLEVLSCEILDDTEMADQTKYPAEYFYTGEVPDINPEEPGKTYVFVKCILKNTTDKPVNSCINLDGFVEVEGSSYLDFREDQCYFDKAQNVSGEDRIHRFFWYDFEPEEELECVLGFGFRETEAGKEKETYYIGHQPLGVDYFTPENTKGLIINVSEIGDGND